MKNLNINIIKNTKGRELYRHWWTAGGHVYSVPQGRGRKPAIVVFAETPHGDGAVLWEENGGLVALEAAQSHSWAVVS